MYLHQTALQNDISSSMKLSSKPTDISVLSIDELGRELQKGMDDIAAGRVVSADEVVRSFKSEYGI